MPVFGELERIAGGLYPYRVPIVIALAIGSAAVVYLLARAGLFRWALRHRLASAVAVAAFAIVALPSGYYLLSPLWRSTELIEASPLTAPASAPAARAIADEMSMTGQSATSMPSVESGMAAPAPQLNLTGVFRGADEFHFGRGTAQIIETEPGKYTVRLEDFAVRNGPDLYVYLSPDANGYAPDAVNLGRLKADRGAFNYEVPDGTDVSRVKSVVIWCRQFSVLFAWASLGQA
jgi:hypothetical protein